MATRNVTKHGQKRLRKRLSIPKASVEANFGKALLHGQKQSEFKGAFRRYLDYWSREHFTAPIVYANTIFFVKDSKLITAWPVPQKFLKYIKGTK